MDNPKKIASHCVPGPFPLPAAKKTSRRTQTASTYTLSHLANDVKSQVGISEPTRDWFPLVAVMGALRRFR
jgi:hypothetical protein